MKKRVIYLIFKPNPSAVVRAELFRSALGTDGYLVSFYYDYLRWLNRFQEYFTKYKVLYLSLYYSFGFVQHGIRWFKRMQLLSSIGHYDAIIAIKFIEPDLLQAIMKRSNAKVLYDFDDAVWLPAFIGPNKFRNIAKKADFISCDNSYLKAEAEKWNRNVFILNGPIQFQLFEKGFRKNETDKIVIGWIGSPSTLFYLYAIYDALEIIGEKFPNAVLYLVGSGYHKVPQFEKLKVVRIPSYDQKSMINYVTNFDIGIYPLFRNELSLGRGSLKATIYMSCKVPAVCSALGGNTQLIKDGANGFLASNTEEWVGKLTRLINSEELRKEMGQAGYTFVKNHFSVQACYNQLKENFLDKL